MFRWHQRPCYSILLRHCLCQAIKIKPMCVSAMTLSVCLNVHGPICYVLYKKSCSICLSEPRSINLHSAQSKCPPGQNQTPANCLCFLATCYLVNKSLVGSGLLIVGGHGKCRHIQALGISQQFVLLSGLALYHAIAESYSQTS